MYYVYLNDNEMPEVYTRKKHDQILLYSSPDKKSAEEEVDALKRYLNMEDCVSAGD